MITLGYECLHPRTFIQTWGCLHLSGFACFSITSRPFNFCLLTRDGENKHWKHSNIRRRSKVWRLVIENKSKRMHIFKTVTIFHFFSWNTFANGTNIFPMESNRACLYLYQRTDPMNAICRDAKSGRSGRYICAIFPQLVLIFGLCTRKTIYLH